MATDNPDEIDRRQEQIEEFLERHAAAQEDNSEMYDNHRTQAEVDIVIQAAKDGIIPSVLDTRDSTGPKDVSFYAVKGYVQTWQKCTEMNETELREKLASLQQAREDKRKPKYRDGSYNQFLAWNTSCQNAIRWLLGEHEQQNAADE
jgi:hypothetical protein